jgi:hypothetical protein
VHRCCVRRSLTSVLPFPSSVLCPLDDQEGWPSGLRRTLGKRVCGKPYRGFESHSLRQLTHPPSFASSRRHSSLSIKPSYFNLFTAVLWSACGRPGSSTAGAEGMGRRMGRTGFVRFLSLWESNS